MLPLLLPQFPRNSQGLSLLYVQIVITFYCRVMFCIMNTTIYLSVHQPMETS